MTAAAMFRYRIRLHEHATAEDRLPLALLATLDEYLTSSGAISLADQLDALERRALVRYADTLERRMQRREGCQGRYRNGSKCRSVAHPFCQSHATPAVRRRLLGPTLYASPRGGDAQ